MKNAAQQAAEFTKGRQKRKLWQRVVAGMACAVVFVTTYALVLPAITMESGHYCGQTEHTHVATCYQRELICGIEEGSVHTHAKDCYAPQSVLICGKEEAEAHVHGEDCYEPERALTCTQEEREAHTHDDACYTTTQTKTCTLEESAAHTHSQKCYDESGALTCGLEESAGHSHGDGCYETTRSLTCQQQEGAGHTHGESCYTSTGNKTLTCGREETEGHAHTEQCYETQDVLTCKLEENVPHNHTDACYEDKLVCELEEHTHTRACESNPEADVETDKDWEDTLPKELTGVWADDLLAVAQSQVGYAESTRNFLVAEDGTEMGYTRYGAWYGQPYGDWRAMFVAFCLHYAEITEEAMPRDTDLPQWIEKLSGQAEGYEAFDLYRAAEDYTPNPGDLVFFDTDADEAADHVGIVTGYSPATETAGAVLETIEGGRGGKVQEMTYDLDALEDLTILGYAALPEKPEEEAAEETVLTQTCEGADYTVTVTYGPEAKIPEGAKLRATEYDKGSEIYKVRYAEAAAFYGWTEDEDYTDVFRLFNIGFFEGGQECEPVEPVKVTITYANQENYQDYQVTHFGETETDKQTTSVEAASGYNNGEQTVDFVVESFSYFGIMPLDLDTAALNGKTFAIVNAQYAQGIGGNGFGSVGNVAVGGNEFVPNGDGTYSVKNKDTTTASEFASAKLWTFEATDGGYYIKLNTNAEAPLYLTTVDQPQYLAVLPEEVQTPSVFTITEGTGDHAGQVKLSSGSYTIALNNDNSPNSFFYATNSAVGDDASYFYLVSGVKVDAGTVQGVTPAGTVINVFDYWAKSPTYDDQGFEFLDEGINNGHYLKFLKSDTDQYGNENKYTGSASVRQGIVRNQLSAGYPLLSYNNESLAYLFNPDIANQYRTTHRNVGNLLQLDTDGYYYYNSTRNYAYLCDVGGPDTNGSAFTLYDTKAVGAGQFFPFNDYGTAFGQTTGDTSELNHHFGLTLTTRFVQQYDGYTNSTQAHPTTFEFSGDDDVWIFIDDVLVADLGGIHAAASVIIDFSTGEVNINNGSNQSTTIQAAFQTAGKEPNGGWNPQDEKIFANDTYHTLKFFYLERGAAASNLSLRSNLAPYPPSGIYKVNQTGDPVAGATFAVYKANSLYEYSGDPVFTGTTDGNGSMTFVDRDGLHYNLQDMKALFGEYFVLVETGVPAGYRKVGTGVVHLHIENNTLVCENTQQSGAWASPTLQVTAPNKLIKVQGGEINYYGGETTNGTLFAVVLKYKGGGLGQQSNWVPVYGTSKDGYQVKNPTDGSGPAFIQAAIDAAKQYTESKNVFALSSSGQMQATLKGMPGDIRTYYDMLGENEKGNTQYIVAYYWSSASSLAGADSSNTFRVDADQTENTYKFLRAFGSTIQVPNLINRLAVQKLNESGELVNGANFAMYRVEETNNKIYYVAEGDNSQVYLEPDIDGNNEGKATLNGSEGNYTVNGDSGEITVEIDGNTYTISPAVNGQGNSLVGTTSGNNSYHEPGTIDFSYVTANKYYIREIKAPAGYALNPTEVMALVTNNAIYANAGTADDGITVARGPGYLADNLKYYAAIDVLDNTLSWIYTQLKISNESTSFENVKATDYEGWKYINKQYAANFSGDTVGQTGNPLTTFLEYHPDSEDALFNYKLAINTAQDSISNNVSNGNRRLYTDIGWSYLEIKQNSAHAQTVDKGGAYYATWDGDLSHLFSRSVYVRVTDQRAPGDLEISKTVVNAPANSTDTFTFTVSFKDADGEPFNTTDTFAYKVYNVDAQGVRTLAKKDGGDYTGTIASGGTISLSDAQVVVIESLPAGTQYTITETKVSNYKTTAVEKVLGTISEDGYKPGTKNHDGNTVTGVMYWHDDGNGNLDKLSKVDFTNTYDPTAQLADLTILKVDAAENSKPLSGAEFLFSRTKDGKTEYYTASGWVAEETVLTSDANGKIELKGIENGDYTLTEKKAPDEYVLLAAPIKVTVEDGKIKTALAGITNFTVTDNGRTLTVPNSPGIKLPETGGVGTDVFVITGFALMFLAGSLLYTDRRKKGGRTDCQ